MTYKTTYWDAATQSQQERDCTPEEIAAIEARKVSPDVRNAPILAQIADLEATVTPRRIRKAVTTIAGKTWMADLDKQIATLRTSLVK